MDIGIEIVSRKGRRPMLIKKDSRMMLRMTEETAAVVKQFSERDTRSFQDQLLYFVLLGIETQREFDSKTAVVRHSLLRATPVSEERKRA